MNFFPIYRYLMFFPVHLQIITLKDFFFLFFRELVTLSERHTDSGKQFAHIKRFCHIIICPQIQCLYFFFLFLSCTDHNDRYLRDFSYIFYNLNPVTIRKSKIQNDHIWSVCIEQCICFSTCLRNHIIIVFFLKTHRDKVNNIFIVFHN